MNYNGDQKKLTGKQSMTIQEQNDDEIDLQQIINKYLSHLPLFIIALILSIGVAFLYLKYRAPTYKSSISILIKDDDKKSGTDMSQQIMSELMMGSKSNVANELELVKSYSLMTKIVNKLGLNVLYSVKNNIAETGLYKDSTGQFIKFLSVKDSLLDYEAKIVIREGRIWFADTDGEREVKNNRTVTTPDFSFVVNISNLNYFKSDYYYKAVWFSPTEMAQIILKQMVVEPLNKEASIMMLSLESSIPNKARDILNTLSAEYNKAGMDEVNQVADSTIKFIDARLALIAGELGIVEKSLLNFREENNVIAIEGQEKFQLDRLKEIRTNMDALDIQMQLADMVGDYVNNNSRSFSLAPSSLGIEDPALLGLVQQYNTQVLRREELLKGVPSGNIAVSTIEGQLKQLQKNIVETSDNLKQSYRSAYNKSKFESDQLLASFNSIPRKEKQMLEIARQQGIKEKLYLYLLEKREEAAIGRASTVGSSSPIDPAYTEKTPVTPKKLIILGIALAVGLGIPVAYIFIKDLLANKVVTRNDILHYTKTPIIGEISHNKSTERQIVADKSRGVIAEQFRIIRTNLQFFTTEKSKSTILVTSSMPGEGKTFISMNVGAVLAATGKKVVLLEFDMRKPKITEALAIQHKGFGLSTFLTGNAGIMDIIHPIPGIENYYFIPTGPLPPNPAELLTTNRIEQLFTELKAEFDHIIVDSPPTIIVSDSKMLTNFCDMCFYVVRQRYTPKEHLKFINDLYINNTLKNMAIVVNDVKLGGSQSYHGNAVSYGYANGYNYDYSHGYGYGEREEKKGWRSWLKSNKTS